jgi:acyl carrier protein
MIEERLKRVIASVIAIEESEFDLNASLVESFNADSFDLVEIAMSIEDEFKIEIPPDDMINFTTVREVRDYIAAKLKK